MDFREPPDKRGFVGLGLVDEPRERGGPMTATDLELRRLAAEQAELREAVEHLTRRLLAAEDRRTGVVLLPLLAELVGGETFTAASAAARALNDRTAIGQAVRELLADVGMGAGGLRSLGRLLLRLDGAALGGVRLVPAGERREGLAWRLVQVSER